MKKFLLIALITGTTMSVSYGEVRGLTPQIAPDTSWFVERVHEVGVTYKCPIIQVGYRIGETKYLFETANFDFVTARPDATTIFRAASISKPVFGYIVMRLVDQGLIELDRPLYQYTDGVVHERFRNAFPNDPVANAQNEEWAKMITARMALTHTAGISANWMRGRRPSNAKITLNNKPGTHYFYSGEGTEYLQRVVEHITGKTLNELAEKHVFVPLGMVYSSFDWREEYHITHAWGYNENNERGTIDDLRTTANGNAANSLRTNAIDISLFLDALMSGYGLSEESFREFTTGIWHIGNGQHSAPGIRVNYNEGTDFGYMLSHSGSNPNFRAMFWLFPEKQTYLIYFTNSENGSEPMRQAIFNIFFPQFSGTE